MSDLVKIKIMPDDDRATLAQFISSGVPQESEFVFEKDQNSLETKLKATDTTCGQTYLGSGHPSDYYLGVKRNGVLEVHPISMFKMNPVVTAPESRTALLTSLTPMTAKEQLEEMKEKFGSRKTKRQLASKRKYAIEFGEEDVEQIEAKTQKITDSTLETANSQTSINDSLDILPTQNRDAICVQEVYDINEIIIETERVALKSVENELFEQIDNQYIKNFMTDPNDSEQKLIANYISLISKIINLKPTALKQPNPIPEMNEELKHLLFNRYLGSKLVREKYQWLINQKQKDCLLIHGIILCLILHNYRPLDMEVLQKLFKVALRQLRKIVEIIGCYVENMKNSSGVNVKSAILKIPLNTLTETKKTFRRK